LDAYVVQCVLRVASASASDAWANLKDVRVCKISAWRGVPLSSGDPFITQKVKGSLTGCRLNSSLAAAFTLILYSTSATCHSGHTTHSQCNPKTPHCVTTGRPRGHDPRYDPTAIQMQPASALTQGPFNQSQILSVQSESGKPSAFPRDDNTSL
jgi:hypothetical protein